MKLTKVPLKIRSTRNIYVFLLGKILIYFWSLKLIDMHYFLIDTNFKLLGKPMLNHASNAAGDITSETRIQAFLGGSSNFSTGLVCPTT